MPWRSQAWQALDEAGRAPYVVQAAADKARYAAEMAVYVPPAPPPAEEEPEEPEQPEEPEEPEEDVRHTAHGAHGTHSMCGDTSLPQRTKSADMANAELEASGPSEASFVGRRTPSVFALLLPSAFCPAPPFSRGATWIQTASRRAERRSFSVLQQTLYSIYIVYIYFG